MKILFNTITTLFIIISHIYASETPSDVQNVKDKYQRITTKINQQYIDRLNVLKVRYTKKGDLDNAKKIVILINQVKSNIKKPTPSFNRDSKFVGRWLLTEGSWSAKFHFKSDGKATNSKGKKANWLVFNEYFIIVYPDGGAKVFSKETKGDPIKMQRIGRLGILKKL